VLIGNRRDGIRDPIIRSDLLQLRLHDVGDSHESSSPGMSTGCHRERRRAGLKAE
jgi:hypothetical protein